MTSNQEKRVAVIAQDAETLREAMAIIYTYGTIMGDKDKRHDLYHGVRNMAELMEASI